MCSYNSGVMNLRKSSILFLWNAPSIAQFSFPLAVGLSFNVKLVRQDGVQTALSVGDGSRTLNLVHLDNFQSETLEEVKQSQGEHNGQTLASYFLFWLMLNAFSGSGRVYVSYSYIFILLIDLKSSTRLLQYIYTTNFFEKLWRTPTSKLASAMCYILLLLLTHYLLLLDVQTEHEADII